MKKISTQTIAEIAEELETGMKVFLNRETLEYRTILDWDNTYGDNEFWDEEMEKIENEWSDYVVLSKMDSYESFKVMERFVDEVRDNRLREDLIKILNRKSPFANFKAEVESSEYRQKWFDFRRKEYEKHVRFELEAEGFKLE